MTVTATEFKANFGKYLELIATEDIFITRNGKTVAKVVNPQISAVDSLRGMLSGVSSEYRYGFFARGASVKIWR